MSDGETKPRLVYVCEGGDCAERGSIELHNDLKEMLLEADPEKRNKVRKYPCFGGCEHGINMTLFPDKVFPFSERAYLLFRSAAPRFRRPGPIRMTTTLNTKMVALI